MKNNVFASVFSDHQGYNVLVFEIDRTNNPAALLLQLSESSDLLAIEPIADIIKPFTANGLERCYFNFVENDKENLVLNGVRELIGSECILLKSNENPKVSLEKLALKINGKTLKVKEHLAGAIYTDLKHADVDNMSHQIANLIHVTDNWNMFIGKGIVEFKSQKRTPTSFEGYLDGDFGY